MPKAYDGYDKRKKNRRIYTYRFMTKDEILQLGYGSHPKFLANDGTIRDIKINGKVRTWKRDPDRIEVPVKYGLYEYTTFDLVEATSRLVVIESEEESNA